MTCPRSAPPHRSRNRVLSLSRAGAVPTPRPLLRGPMYRPETLHDAIALVRRSGVVREAQAAAALDHPNIVRMLDADAAHDPPYLVMEYVDGVSLQAAVVRTGPFSPGETASVGRQVARGLGHAAAVGLVHRDIKP